MDNNDERLSLNMIWQKGCRGEPLSNHDQRHFADMARARFHTFTMSAGHAAVSRSDSEAEDWIRLLVRGLVVELSDNPGLERQWHDSEVAKSRNGQRVTASLLAEVARPPS